jgi:hypothetical protein
VSVIQTHKLVSVLIQAIESSGFAVSGPADVRAAENGEPAWVCTARGVLAKTANDPDLKMLAMLERVHGAMQDTSLDDYFDGEQLDADVSMLLEEIKGDT